MQTPMTKSQLWCLSGCFMAVAAPLLGVAVMNRSLLVGVLGLGFVGMAACFAPTPKRYAKAVNEMEEANEAEARRLKEHPPSKNGDSSSWDLTPFL